MQAIMQASYQGIDALKLITQSVASLNPMAVRVETRYTPVIPYDILTETGQLQRLRPVKLPRVIGYGFGGIVREVGHLRPSRLLNQPVIGIHLSGSHQEQILSMLPPFLFTVPAGVSLAAATTLIGGADAAYFALKQSHLQPNETVLVTGTNGSVGTYLLQLLHLFGYHSIAVGHSSRHDLLTSLGAEQIVDYDRPFAQQKVNFAAVSHVIDLAGSPALLDRLTAELGPVRILSLALQDYRPHLQQTFAFASGAITPRDYRWLLTQLAERNLRAIVQEKLPFTAIKTAQHHLLDHHAAGRILVTYNQEG